MLRPVLLSVLFLLSLFTVFRAPTNLLWYVSILVTEFCWIFFAVTLAVLSPVLPAGRYPVFSIIIGLLSVVLFAIPVIQAYTAIPKVKSLFGIADDNAHPFTLGRMITGMAARNVSFTTLTYDPVNKLTLDFYRAKTTGARPCVVVVHGGSWAGGDSRQLPELNSELAKAGYHVATINYRLAPTHKFPVPIEDLHTALSYLTAHATELLVDTTNYILLGRSAGGQIVLAAAYTKPYPGMKGVISFYGPADMVWGYANPTNPLVLNSRKVMEDYLGGTYQQVPQQYVKSSPIEVVTAGGIPTLLLHGQNDPLVSDLHAVRLGRRLDQAGIAHYNIYLPWATHGFDYTLNGPGGQISTWCVLRFIEKVTR